jgi:3-hydroxyisobutyrate dehydrogenase
MDIGLCGTGRMGTAMVHRLLDQGHALTVWNRNAVRIKPLLERGAKPAASPTALAAGHAIVITTLTDAAAIAAVYDGPQGLLSGDVAGKLFIEMSTVTPETTRKLATRVRRAGAALVECPVGGSVGPARNGKLLGLAGGEPADFARARPILEQLCRRVDHVGRNGAGSAMKLAINLPLIVYWETLGEALSLVSDLDLAPAKLLEIMNESPGGTNALKIRAPTIAAVLAGATPEVGFDLNGMRKDLVTMLEFAGARGVDIPAAAKTLESFDAAVRDGLGDRDNSLLIAWRVAKAAAPPRA